MIDYYYYMTWSLCKIETNIFLYFWTINLCSYPSATANIKKNVHFFNWCAVGMKWPLIQSCCYVDFVLRYKRMFWKTVWAAALLLVASRSGETATGLLLYSNIRFNLYYFVRAWPAEYMWCCEVEFSVVSLKYTSFS